VTDKDHGPSRALDLISIEDSDEDAELIADALDGLGLTPILRRVETEQALFAALNERLPDAILSDWALPHFSGRRAVEIAHDLCPEVPFIFVSGTFSEASAIDALRQGAIDYVFKHQLKRLAPVLARALGEARTMASLRKSEALNRAILDSVNAEIAVLDRDGIIIAVNEPWRQFSLQNSALPGIAAPNTGVGSDYLAACQDGEFSTSGGSRGVVAGIQDVQGGRLDRFSLEYPCHSPEKERWFVMSVTPLDTDHRSVVVTHVDVTERKMAEDKIQLLAFYDNLTGLPNRRLLYDRLQRALAASARSKREGALLFIDLDNFKHLNDLYGHNVGDAMLVQVAQRLNGCVREGDTVARLGGDEFVVLLENLHEKPEEAAATAKIIGQKILAILHRPYQLADQQHLASASIGVTMFLSHRDSIDELLKRADIAMYQAKTAGRHTIRFFDQHLQSVVATRVAMEADLRAGIDADQLVLYFQPQTDGIGGIIGAEALVRWRHPGLGLVSPAEFIPLAEETGLILPLGNWVLNEACLQIAAWSGRRELSHVTVAVNVSARQFQQEDFVASLLDVLARTNADPRKLKLELTESMLVNDIEDVIIKMESLKKCGIRFSLDDFGTGYSSLSYLKRLPLSQLKIDQSFVRDVTSDANDAAIARTIISLGQTLGLEVIAEAVETEGQRSFLADLGCHAYQGYLFGRPGPADEFERLFADPNKPQALIPEAVAPLAPCGRPTR
jgi:diguanylate cyclase (GGDEF)-like protein